MKEIPLTNGGAAIIDDADYDFLMQWKWRRNADGYAIRGFRQGFKRLTVSMHRVIADAPDGMLVDHANGNRLDNRRSNLRVCTYTENNRNRKPSSNSKTGYKGVRFNTKKGYWTANISTDSGIFEYFPFDTAEDAARFYNEIAREYHGEFARLNVID